MWHTGPREGEGRGGERGRGRERDREKDGSEVAFHFLGQAQTLNRTTNKSFLLFWQRAGEIVAYKKETKLRSKFAQK